MNILRELKIDQLSVKIQPIVILASFAFAVTGWTQAGIVRLAWEPSEELIQGYKVYRASGQQAAVLLTSHPLTSPAYEDRSAENGVLHYYRVTTVGHDGVESDFSNPVAAIPGEREDLRIRVQPPSSVVAGTRANFQVTVSNHGTAPNGSMLRITLSQPEELDWDGWSGEAWTCSETPTKVECDSEVILLNSQSSTFFVRFKFHPRVEPRVAIQADLRTAQGVVQSIAEPVNHIAYGLYAPYFLTPDSGFAGVSLTNHSDQPAQVDMTVFDPSGFAPGPDDPTITINPWSQFVRLSYDHQPAGVQPATGWLGVTTDSPDVGGFFQFGDRRLSQLDGARLFNEPRREIVFTRVTFGTTRFLGHSAETILDLVNPTEDEAVMEAELVLTSPAAGHGFAQQVDAKRTEQLILAPKQLLQVSPEELFGEWTAGSGYLRIRVLSGEGVIGFQRLRFNGGSSAAGLAAGSPRGRTLYSSHIAQSRDVFTHLKLINISTHARSVQLFAIGERGQLLAPTVSLRMEPNQVLEGTVGQIFEFSEPERVSGSLEIRADGPGLLGNVIFGDPNSLRFAAAVPLESDSHLQLAFDYFASTSEFFTGLAICNTAPENADVTLEALDREGSVLASAQLTLGPRHLISQTLAELMPAVKGQVGGYLRLASTRPLIAQQLFGHRNLDFLSAVPAEELR